MAFKIKKAGSMVDPTTVKRRSGGAWVTPTAIKRRSGGAWITVWPVATAHLENAQQNSIVLDPGDATARLGCYDDGKVYGQGYLGNLKFTWRLSGVAADYEFRATHVSGTIASGTFGSWLAGDSNPSWSLTQTAVGSGSSVFTIEVRHAGGSIIDSATFTLYAEVFT